MEMQIIFSESVSLDTVEYGSCYVSKWPRPPIDSVAVTTNNGNCKIKTLSVRFIDAYTTAVFFMIQVNSFCNRVTCFEPSRQEDRAINICKHYQHVATECRYL